MEIVSISGDPVDGNFCCDGFVADLKDDVARALRLSPNRLMLSSGDAVLTNEQPVDSSFGVITYMVEEGQELPEWCAGELSQFEFDEVDGVGPLPQGAEDLGGPRILEAIIAWKLRGVRKSIQNDVKRETGRQTCPPLYCLEDDASIPKTSESRYFERYKELQQGLVCAKALLERVEPTPARPKKKGRKKGPGANQPYVAPTCFYSRWASHAGEAGEVMFHRVYGIRQANSAVELHKFMGGWIEIEGTFDEEAIVDSIRRMWTDSMCATKRSVERQESCSDIGRNLENALLLIMTAKDDPKHQWAARHTDIVTKEISIAIDREVYILAADTNTLGPPSGCSQFDVLRVCVRILVQLAQSVEGGLTDAMSTLCTLAGDRNVALRLLGLDFLATYGIGLPGPMETIELMAKHDWTVVKQEAVRVLEQAGAGESSVELQAGHATWVSASLPSPRSLLLRGFSGITGATPSSGTDVEPAGVRSDLQLKKVGRAIIHEHVYEEE